VKIFHYTDSKYKKEFENFKKNIDITREQITKIVEQNNIFKSFIYTSYYDSNSHYSINTWNTRI